MNLLRSSKFHAGAVVVWIILLFPSMTVWKDSIMWVIFISIYANIISHITSYQSAKQEKK